MSKKTVRRTKMTVTYILLGLALLWTIFPLYWMFKSSITVGSEMHVARPSLFGFTPTFEHYIDLFQNAQFHINLGNSLLIALITTAAGLLISILIKSPAAVVIRAIRRLFPRLI